MGWLTNNHMKKFKLKFVSALLFCLTPLTSFAVAKQQITNGYFGNDFDANTKQILHLGGLDVNDGSGIISLSLGSVFGTKIGITGNKLGFFGAAPIVKPTGDILVALAALGLINSPTIPGGGGGGGSVNSITGDNGSTTGLTLGVIDPTNDPVLTIGGILNKTHGGTGTTTPSLVAGTNVTITGTWPNQTINSSGGGGGGVSSVGISVPSILSISGSPVTGSGTISISLAAQSAWSLFGNFTGSSAAPAFTTSALPSRLGGTGLTFPAGVLFFNGTSPASAVTGAQLFAAMNGSSGHLALTTSGSSIDGVPLNDGTHDLRNLKAIATDDVLGRITGISPTTSTQNIYTSINHTTPAYARSISHVLANVDLTAISVWNSSGDVRNSCTLISPNVAIGAWHFTPRYAPGTTVRFVSNTSSVVTLTVAAIQQVGVTDIVLVKFTTNAPASITPVKVLLNDLPLNAGKAFWLDQNWVIRMGTALVTHGIGSGGFVINVDGSVGAWSGNAVGGDSSHPMFVVMDGRFIFLGAIQNGTPDGESVAASYAAINAAMADPVGLNAGTQLTPLAIQSVGTAAYLDAAEIPAVGQIPVVKSSGFLDDSIIPPASLAFGTQLPRTVLANHTDSSGTPTFANLLDSDLPAQITSRETRATFSDANFTSSWYGISYLGQIGTLTAPRTASLPSILASPGAPFPGLKLIIADESGTCSSTNSITVLKGNVGAKIDGLDSFILDTPYSWVSVEFTDGGKWKVIGRGTSDNGAFRSSIKIGILAPAQAVVSTNVATLSGLQNFDGYTFVDGDTVLLTGQSAAANNGPWQQHSGAWTRPTDFATNSTVIDRIIKVRNGTVGAGTLWTLTAPAIITVGATNQVWTILRGGNDTIFSNSLTVGSGGPTHYSLFGASQPVHGPNANDQLYVGNSSTITTQTIIRAIASTMEFDGLSTSDARMIGATLLACSNTTATGDMTGATGQTPAGLIGSVNRVYHRGSGTLSRAFGALADVENTPTGGNVTDSAGFFAQNPSVKSGSTWNSFASFYAEGGSITGTISTRYGLYVPTITGGTTNWGVNVQSDKSFFGGDTTIAGLLKTGSTPITLTDAAGKTVPGTTTGIEAWDADLDVWAGVTPAAGIATFLGTPTSANLASAVTTKTGTGLLTFATSPSFTTPSLGAATATSLAASGVVTGSNLTAAGVVTGTAAIAPITIFVKNVTVLTAGTPADAVSIPIPAGVTRFRFGVGAAANTSSGMIAETASGTLAGAAFTIRDTASGAGTALSTSVNAPATVGTYVAFSGTSGAVVSSASTLYLNQTSSSAFAGTLSFYITLYPIP